MNPFNNLGTEGLESATDSLGGASLFDSGVYPGTIKVVYAGKSEGGAQNVTVVVQIADREYRETVYVTNRQGENWYPNKRDASKKMPLPGFTTANDLALLSTGVSLSEQTWEEKVVKIWDGKSKAEVPTKVLVAVDMTGKSIKLGLLRNKVDRTKKDDVTNTYVPTGETREENTIDKVFHHDTGKTVSEFTAKAETAEFVGKWEAKNAGQIRDKSTGGEGKAGVPGAAPTAGKAPNKSLFT